MFINVEETPNPDTLKFIPENELEVEFNIYDCSEVMSARMHK